jgi:hypothetical protein
LCEHGPEVLKLYKGGLSSSYFSLVCLSDGFFFWKELETGSISINEILIFKNNFIDIIKGTNPRFSSTCSSHKPIIGTSKTGRI